MALWGREQMQQAEAAFRKALEIDEQSAGAWLGLGYVRMQQRQWEQAQNCFRRALEIDPSIEESRRCYEAARLERERGLRGTGCAAAPRFSASPFGGPLYCLCLILPVLLRRGR